MNLLAFLVLHCPGTQTIPGWGWRLSLGLAAVPAVILTLGGALLPETPNSLVERGHHAQVPQRLTWQ